MAPKKAARAEDTNYAAAQRHMQRVGITAFCAASVALVLVFADMFLPPEVANNDLGAVPVAGLQQPGASGLQEAGGDGKTEADEEARKTRSKQLFKSWAEDAREFKKKKELEEEEKDEDEGKIKKRKKKKKKKSAEKDEDKADEDEEKRRKSDFLAPSVGKAERAAAVRKAEQPPVDLRPDGWPKLPRQNPEGVHLPEDWQSPWDGTPDFTSKEVEEATFGFYFPIFNQAAPAILELLRSVRKYYPDSPVHVLQDGGSFDFGGVCELEQYKCTFEQVPPENSRWNPHSWLLRFHAVAKKLATTYVIYLEPDVIVRGRHRFHPPYDAGGIYDSFNPALHEEVRAYMQHFGREVNPCFKLRWKHFGLAGGSYYRTAAILDAFAPENVAKIDWQALFKFEGERLFSSDIAMHVALSMRGYMVYPWREAAQKWKDGAPDFADGEKAARFNQKNPAFNPLAAFEHNHKEHYDAKVPGDEMRMIRSGKLKRYIDLYCHGCVWHTGPKLEEQLKVKNPRTWDLFPPPDVQDEHYKYADFRKEQYQWPEGPSPDDTCFPTGAAERKPESSPEDEENEKEEEDVAPAPAPAPTPAPPVTRKTTSLLPSSVTPLGVASSFGLPLLKERPGWLEKDQDGLVVDARESSKGGMLLAQIVFNDGRNEWGNNQFRPPWVRAVLGTHRNHIRKNKKAFVVRWKPSLRWPAPWQDDLCNKKENQREITNCWLNTERENFNWEKEQMMLEYLQSPQEFSHVLILDADAALVRDDQDTLQHMADVLEKTGKELMIANEDWIPDPNDGAAATRINGGMLFAKNTKFVRDLLEDMLDAHWNGDKGLPHPKIGGGPIHGCASNEQLCLDAVRNHAMFKQNVLMESGLKYNCGAHAKSMQRLKEKDPDLMVLHFMGGAKAQAVKALCKTAGDLTGEGPQGYGCSPGSGNPHAR